MATSYDLREVLDKRFSRRLRSAPQTAPYAFHHRGIDLIHRRARDDPTWSAPRIQSTLRLPGYDVADSIVARYMPRGPTGPSSHRGRTFLRNHLHCTVACNFFVVRWAASPVRSRCLNWPPPVSATFEPGIPLSSTARDRTCALQLDALILDGGMNPLENEPATRLRSWEVGTDGVLSKDSSVGETGGGRA